MRYLNTNLTWAIPATLAIAVIWLVSAVANYYFGASLGTDKPFEAVFFTTTTAELFSSASLAADVLKCVTLFAFAASVAMGLWRPAMVTGAIWLVCTAWSVASAVGFVAINHNSVTDNRGKGVEEWSQLDTQIKNLTERRKQVESARPEGTVQAEINQLLRTPGVGSCTVVNGPVPREICPQVDKLRIELENAKSAAWLDGRLDALRAEVRASDRVTSENPFADLAGGLLGVVATKITTGQALWFALLLELISGPGLWGIWAAVPKPAQKPQEASGAGFQRPLSLDASKFDPAYSSPYASPRTPMRARGKLAGIEASQWKITGPESEVFRDAPKNPPEPVVSKVETTPDPDGPGTPAPAPGPVEPTIEDVMTPATAKVLDFYRKDNPNAEYRIIPDKKVKKERLEHAEVKDFVRDRLGINQDALRTMKTAIKERKAVDDAIRDQLMDSPEVYELYQSWCDDNHFTAKSPKAFSGDLWDHCGLPKGTRKMKGVKGLRNASGYRFPVYAKEMEVRRKTA